MEDVYRSLGTLIFLAPLLIPVYLGYYLLFEKAGEKGWKFLIPIYGTIVLLKITGRPWWWVFYLFIPVIGWLIAIGVVADFIKSFGRNKLSDIAMAVILPFIYMPYLAFKKDVTYKGPATEIVSKKSVTQEWTEAIGFAVIAATLIRWLIMEAYTIPTPSMENSLLVGDFLFVSKFHYGTRTTSTPLQVPLTHQKIWFTNIPSYVEWIKLPPYRLPGLSEVKREDVVVFNVPPKILNEGIDYPPDLKTNYIKRCVAIPGDSLVIKDSQVIVNGTPLANPPDMQFSYIVTAKSNINPLNLEKLDLNSEDYQLYSRLSDGKVVYLMFLTEGKANEIKGLPYIHSIEKQERDVNDVALPYSSYYALNRIPPDSAQLFHWSGDNFGALWIPKEGATIQINRTTLALYGPTIQLYDHNEDVKIEGNKLIIDGKEVSEYTFKQNYYFMMGDNRHNSLDSRYWGFVPEDHIVGKAFFIWLSINKEGGFFNKIRWNRFFKLIK